tara:strand:- start:241 stop:522 length:282 start_codon:yes stop_codon:yes gene_type:complete
MDNNKLIAEFMGVGKLYEAQSSNQWNQYHTSWDWLMPVVDKCTQIGFRDTDTDDNPLYELWDRLFCDNMGQFVGNHIDEVYNSVVEFIKEYNK